MNILVTGGAGFIGSHIVEYHLNHHDAVHVIDDLSSGLEENINPFKSNPNFHFTKADLLIWPDIEKEVAWADCIYHMAAVVGVLKVIKALHRVLSVNIGATERLLRAARLSHKKPRILIASTSEVYGSCDLNSSDEEANLIVGIGKKSCATYNIGKLAAESFGMTYFQEFGIPVTILRLFNTIGPRQIGAYGMVVPRFIESAVKNEPIVVYGTGTQTRSFCDVRDLVAMMYGILNNSETIGQIINIGHDQEVSINDIAQRIKVLAKSHSEIRYISYHEAYGDDFEDFMCRGANFNKLQKLMNYHYQWDLEKTFTDLIARHHLTC